MKRALFFAVVIFAFMFIGCSDDGAKEKNDDTSFLSTYDYVTSFHNGYAAARLDDKWGFVDKTGKEIISPIYELANSFYEGLASIKYDDIASFDDREIVSYKIDDKYGFVNKKGEEVTPPRYTEEEAKKRRAILEKSKDI
jgi:hypothetical protein